MHSLLEIEIVIATTGKNEASITYTYHPCMALFTYMFDLIVDIYKI